MINMILPGDPEFDFTLATARPPGWRQVSESSGEAAVFVADHATGVLRAVTGQALTDYLYGGEYDERMSNLEELDNAMDLNGDNQPDNFMADLLLFNSGTGF